MMVLYRSPEYQALKVYNEDQYQIIIKKEKTHNFYRALGP